MSCLCVCVCVYVIFMGLCVCVFMGEPEKELPSCFISVLTWKFFCINVYYIYHYMFGLLCTECRVMIFFIFFFQQQKAVDVYLFDVYELLYTAGCRPQAGYLSNCDSLGHNSGMCTVLCRLCFNSSGWL